MDMDFQKFTLHMRDGWFTLFHTPCKTYVSKFPPGVGLGILEQELIEHIFECVEDNDRN